MRKEEERNKKELEQMPVEVEEERKTKQEEEDEEEERKSEIKHAGILSEAHLVKLKLFVKDITNPQREEFWSSLRQDMSLFMNNNKNLLRQGTHSFIKCLERIYNAIIVRLGYGCLEITVQCSTLDSLELLWSDTGSGKIGEIAKNYLVTSTIKTKLGVENITFKAEIREEDYLACKESFNPLLDQREPDQTDQTDAGDQTGPENPVADQRETENPTADRREPEHSLELESPTANRRELEIPGRGERRKLVCFMDMSEVERRAITRGLESANLVEPFKEALQKVGCDTIINSQFTEDTLQEFLTANIRSVTDQIRNQRKDVIEVLRGALPTEKGVFGPRLHPNTFIEELVYTDRSNLARNLSGDTRAWSIVAEKMGIDGTTIRAIGNKRNACPGEEVLKECQFKGGSTIGFVYDILVGEGMEVLADKF